MAEQGKNKEDAKAVEYPAITILQTSPRKAGNSSAIATTVQTLCAKHISSTQSLYLAEYKIIPCTACDVCKHFFTTKKNLQNPATLKPAFACPLTMQDNSAAVLANIFFASSIFVVAPVYFYHLPAHFKGLIDRFQTFWNMHENGCLPTHNIPKRWCFPILLAGRKQGPRLFEGSLLTLKQAFKAVNMTLAEPLLLYGLDQKQDFHQNPAAQEKLHAYIMQCLDIYRANGVCLPRQNG